MNTKIINRLDAKGKRLTHAALALIGLWLVAEFVLLGPASVVVTASNGELIVPALLGERYAEPGRSLWQAIASSGDDKTNYTFYNPIDIFLFTTLPGWLAHGLRVASVLLAALFGAYAVARRLLGFGRAAALFVAAAYTAPVHGILLNALTGYLPLVILALHFVLELPTRWLRWAGLAAALFAFADMSYFSQFIIPGPAVLIFWFLFVDTRSTGRDWVIILGVCAAGVALRFDILQAVFAYGSYSYMEYARETPDVVATWRSAFTQPYFLAAPLQTICTALFGLGLATAFRSNRRTWGVGLALAIGWLIFPLSVTVQAIMAERIPFLSAYRVGYMMFLPLTVLPFAAGFGIETLVRWLTDADGPRHRVRALLAGVGIFVAIAVVGTMSLKVKYAHLYGWVTNGSFAHNYRSPAIEEFAVAVRDQPWPVRVESFQIIPNYLHAYGLETAGGYQALHLKRYYEFWAKMAEPWAASLGPESRFYSQYEMRRKISASDMMFRDDRLWLFPENYQSEWELSKLYHLNLLSLANVGYLLSKDRLVDPSLIPVKEMARPWSAMSKREKARLNIGGNFTGREHLFIYRNKNVFPRFFTVDAIKPFKAEKSVLAAMQKASIADLRSAVFVDKNVLPPGLSVDRAYGTVDIKLDHYSSDEIRLSVKSEQPAILIVTNSFSPFWTVEIDGKPGRIFPAYHTFWGVSLPQGARSVVFRYDPPYR